MNKVKFPSFSAEQVLELCADSINSKPHLAVKLRNSINSFSRREAEYRIAGLRSDIFNIAEEAEFCGINTKEMSILYDQTFVKSKYTRPIYNALKQAATNNICPLCNQRTVGSLDHHLSKSHHPALAVTPFNLIPACRECNENTGARRPMRSMEQTIHPYFDDVSNEIWLVASLEEIIEPSVRYSVIPPQAWPPQKAEIVINHFTVFDLGTLYTTHAAVEISNIMGELIQSHKAGGWLAVAEDMVTKARSRRRYALNSWQAAFYQAASESQWFCDGGYLSFVQT